jgi:hypothetical protein
MSLLSVFHAKLLKFAKYFIDKNSGLISETICAKTTQNFFQHRNPESANFQTSRLFMRADRGRQASGVAGYPFPGGFFCLMSLPMKYNSFLCKIQYSPHCSALQYWYS